MIIINDGNFQISRGSSNPREMTTSTLREHLKIVHPEVDINGNDQTPGAAGGNVTDAESRGSSKRSGTMAKLYELCPKKNRGELFQSTIPGWVESKTELDFHGAKAQRFHKSIFEMLVLDLAPFYEVHKPGFLRHHQIMYPNFTVASPTYYRSMLEPSYDAVKAVLMDKLEVSLF